MQNDWAVVTTGAAGSIGTVLVERFLANGDTVVATDTSADALEVWRQGSDDVAHLADVVREHAGHLDVLVNCAGHFPLVSFEDMTDGQWRQVIDINLTGVHLVTKALLPLVRDRGWGRIVGSGSGSVFDGTAR